MRSFTIEKSSRWLSEQFLFNCYWNSWPHSQSDHLEFSKRNENGECYLWANWRRDTSVNCTLVPFFQRFMSPFGRFLIPWCTDSCANDGAFKAIPIECDSRIVILQQNYHGYSPLFLNVVFKSLHESNAEMNA